MAKICVDACLVVAWLVPTDRTPEVQAFWDRVLAEETDLIGPPLLFAETLSALRKLVYFGKINAANGDEMRRDFLDMGIRQLNPAPMYPLAWDMAKRFNLPNVYDLLYVALAQLERCDFWTVDQRLINSVGDAVSWTRFAGATR